MRLHFLSEVCWDNGAQLTIPAHCLLPVEADAGKMVAGQHPMASWGGAWQCCPFPRLAVPQCIWVGASQSFASVYPVCAGGYNPLRGALWVEVAGSGNWRLTALLPSPFILEPHSLCSQIKWTLATPSFWSKQVLNSCHEQSSYKPILIVWMWELDYKESWVQKNWCFWTVVLEKTLESPLDCKEIQSVHPKGAQSWVFIGRTDVKAKTPILWSPRVKSWLIWKDPDAGKDWRQEEKGTTEDEMVAWHHWLNGHGFGWTLGVGDGQGGLACCGSWGHKESDTTEWLNWTESDFPSVQWKTNYILFLRTHVNHKNTRIVEVRCEKYEVTS